MSPSKVVGRADFKFVLRSGNSARRWTRRCLADKSAKRKSGDKSPHSKAPGASFGVFNIARRAFAAMGWLAFSDPAHPHGGCYFWRQDDVSVTVYFYLGRPGNNLPPLASGEVRLKDRHEKVWSKANPRK